ncbi:hypothetical protein pb186bvf_015443 [Paramecium bursaria]
MNRTKRLNSLILSPQDLGKSIDLPEIKITIQSQPNRDIKALRTQLMKYKNLQLYEKVLLRKNTFVQEYKKNLSVDITDKIIISPLDSQQLCTKEQKLYQPYLIKLEKPIKNKQEQKQLPLRKISINTSEKSLQSVYKILPSIRAWDNQQNSRRSN